MAPLRSGSLESLRERNRLRTTAPPSAIRAAAEQVDIAAGTLGERAEVLGALALAGREASDRLSIPAPHASQSSISRWGRESHGRA